MYSKPSRIEILILIVNQSLTVAVYCNACLEMFLLAPVYGHNYTAHLRFVYHESIHYIDVNVLSGLVLPRFYPKPITAN